MVKFHIASIYFVLGSLYYIEQPDMLFLWGRQTCRRAAFSRLVRRSRSRLGDWLADVGRRPTRWPLPAKHPEDLDTLSGRLGLHPRASRDFFDALVALGFLQRNNGK